MMHNTAETPAAPPESLMCPITFSLMDDPVLLAGDGYTYDKRAIREWFDKQIARGLPTTSPLTGLEIDCQMFPNRAIKDQIQAWRAALLVSPNAGADAAPADAAKIGEKEDVAEEKKEGEKAGAGEDKEGAWSEVVRGKADGKQKGGAQRGGGKEKVLSAIPPKSMPCPNKANRIAKRTMQIDAIKTLECYVRYLAAVPKAQRGAPHVHPRTPDPSGDVDASIPEWAATMNHWRTRLHEWDAPDDEHSAAREREEHWPAGGDKYAAAAAAPALEEMQTRWLQAMFEMGIDEATATRAARSPHASSLEEAITLALAADDPGPKQAQILMRCYICKSLLAESSIEAHQMGKAHRQKAAVLGLKGAAAMTLGSSADMRKMHQTIVHTRCLTCRERECDCMSTKRCFVCSLVLHIDAVASHVYGKKHALLCLQQGVPEHLVFTLGDPRWAAMRSLTGATATLGASLPPLPVLPNAPRLVSPPPNGGRPTIPKALFHRCVPCGLDMSVNEVVAHEAGRKHRTKLGLT